MYAFNYNDRLITFPSVTDLLIILSTNERKFQVQFLSQWEIQASAIR